MRVASAGLRIAECRLQSADCGCREFVRRLVLLLVGGLGRGEAPHDGTDDVASGYVG